eukprot:TRINITY_DN40373_c0_g1_i1.p2 TRINITY_DN40373_c0_g1~~TRINITY_DN40373_c0_g1_i1.p2  ORF type:complete len:105 (+),score=38.33 TRINITY_DN40373_c0_g1_i1:41-316(+)
MLRSLVGSEMCIRDRQKMREMWQHDEEIEQVTEELTAQVSEAELNLKVAAVQWLKSCMLRAVESERTVVALLLVRWFTRSEEAARFSPILL